MKKYLALLLAALLAISLVSCSTKSKDGEKEEDAAEAGSGSAADTYVMSDSVAEESVIGGVMTSINGDDPVLKKTTASWLDTCVLYEVNVRQFTEEGTFKAFEDHLERLKAMGINTLWFMPIHPISEKERKGTLGSYYSVSDYTAVNPEFGTLEDFRHLVDKAHDMGFKVILDWVANHTGWDNKWITEHDSWYKHDDKGEITYPYDWSDVAQLDYDNYEMRAEMIKCMQYWVEDVGIDGFRCDYAIGVPATFWNAAVYKLKSVNSEIMMLAETSAAASLTKYAFDCCYNDALYGQAMMTKGGAGVSSIESGMTLNQNYCEGSFPMNYLDNHDKNSYEGSVVSRCGDAYQPLLALTFITPGLPLIYTSDEEGYDHEIEFFEKDAVKWDSEPEYAELISALSRLKSENAALASSNTDISFIKPDNDNIFAFSRSSGGNTVVYVANLFYEQMKDVSVDLGFDSAECVLHYDGAACSTDKTAMTKDDFMNRDYEPYEFYVLVVD